MRLLSVPPPAPPVWPSSPRPRSFPVSPTVPSAPSLSSAVRAPFRLDSDSPRRRFRYGAAAFFFVSASLEPYRFVPPITSSPFDTMERGILFVCLCMFYVLRNFVYIPLFGLLLWNR